MSQEKIIDTLVEGIMNVQPEFWDNPNGAYEWTCPFCQSVYRGVSNPEEMDGIVHEIDCTYKFALALKAVADMSQSK